MLFCYPDSFYCRLITYLHSRGVAIADMKIINVSVFYVLKLVNESLCSNKHTLDYLCAFRIILSWEESVLRRHFVTCLPGVKNKISHLLTTEDGVECPHCDRVFKNQYMLDEHIHIHTGEKRYKCEMCEKLYSTRESLRSHMKGHQFQFGCEICAKPLGSYSAFMWVKLFTRDSQFLS